MKFNQHIFKTSVGASSKWRTAGDNGRFDKKRCVCI